MSNQTIAPVLNRTAFFSSVSDDVWHESVSPKGFEWWHFDAVSDDGREAVVIQFADNYVFSPRYMALDAETDRPRRHPAVTFLYSVDGKTVFKTITEYSPRQFSADKISPKCSIGDCSFHVESADYGSGYMVSVNIPLGGNRRLKASFEWLSIEADLLSDEIGLSASPDFWNMAATRSDVSGKIELVGRSGRVKRQFQFRGTGYHDHVGGCDAIYESVDCRQWGRAHFIDSTVVYCVRSYPTGQQDARLFLIRDGKIHEREAKLEQVRFRRDRYGIKYPTRLTFVSEDNIRLRVKLSPVIDSGFYELSFLNRSTLMLRDGKPRKTVGFSHMMVPRNLKYRLFRWISDLKIGKNNSG